MTKTIKKTPAILAIAIITLLSLCITAFAAGTFTITPTGSPGNVTAKITFSNLNDIMQRVIDGDLETFITGSRTTYNVAFTPTAGSSTTFQICDTDSTNTVVTIMIPQWSSGMPTTLTSTVKLKAGHAYAVKMKSDSPSVNTRGSFTIYGLDEVI